ncbi:NAD(P)H-binding protein [Sulfitobacter sp. S190]|uniref:NAD(P)H-binding protein n=1 Tax=Sulfitobacter sp. S190 TaxID=2867022 RepID=UPI0021A284AB|nr:NAD(P)H-binding protein [Sulfitobacter sp. S190]UWR22104.1 NAD(P)H-binding protein [Sulfitobacter sp. S190]
MNDSGQRILMIGATGTAGRATTRALVAAGHDVVCLVRKGRRLNIDGAIMREADVTQTTSIAADGIRGEAFDCVVSCLASRSGTPTDAWAIDHAAQTSVLEAAQAAGIDRFVLLSAICVQKPQLAFQHAKLAFEAALIASGMTYVIVRPTAFFKSLSGQIDRVRAGKPYLLFGNGTLTACKPISDRDLGAFIARCVVDPDMHNRVLPVGGPGPALTPRAQAEALFDLLGKTPAFRQVSLRLFDVVGGALSLAAPFSRVAANKAALARIGRYYASESMLVWDAEAGRYDADATPEFGADTLVDHYRRLIESGHSDARGDHSVF